MQQVAVFASASTSGNQGRAAADTSRAELNPEFNLSDSRDTVTSFERIL
jgi:hypothetical protein